MPSPPQGETGLPRIGSSGPTSISSDAPLFTPLLRDLLAEGLSVRFSARGNSMCPSILDGDIVTVCPVSQHPVPPGSVVLHLRAGAAPVFAHRVVGRSGPRRDPTYRIRGDAGWLHADRVPAADVIGIAGYLERHGKARNLCRPASRLYGLARSQLRALRTRVLLAIRHGRRRR